MSMCPSPLPCWCLMSHANLPPPARPSDPPPPVAHGRGGNSSALHCSRLLPAIMREPSQGPRLALLAVGTRGDVQPLLALAIALRADLSASAITFVTHQAHEDWVLPPAQAAGLHLTWLSTPPARVWLADGAGTARIASQPAAVDRDRQREEVLAACEAALGLSLGSSLPEGAQGQAAAQAPARLVIFNLFALEGFHLAEALGVPCLAASPCLVPYAPPPGFEQPFQQEHPQLYARLQEADAVQRAQGSPAPTSSSVGWSDVRHWLWPLFGDSWGAWRHHRLGLPAVPFSDCQPDKPLPPPLLLLYGVSETIVPRPGHWPSSARICGYWGGDRCFTAAQRQLPPAIEALLGGEVPGQGPAGVAGAAEAATAGPVCVDFGSMGLLGLLPRPEQLAAVLGVAARQLDRRMLVLTGGWQALQLACEQLLEASEAGGDSPQPWLVPHAQALPHEQLLPRCAALLHHGGAGTVAAALRCGIPQLACPLHFDQQQWAERVEWLGCGAQIRPAALLQAAFGGAGTADNCKVEEEEEGRDERGWRERTKQAGQALASTLSSLLGDASVAQQCASMRQQLAGENGLGAAVQVVRQQLEPGVQQQARRRQQARHQQEQQAQQEQQENQGQPDSAAAPAMAPSSWQPLLPPPQQVELPGGLTVQCHSPGEVLFIHGEVFTQDCYLSEGIQLGPGSVVVDAGANVGLFALRLLLDPQLAPLVERVFAFEPLPPTANVLEANLRAHGVADKVSVIRCGLHSSPATLPFTFYPAMPGNSTAAPREKWEHQRPAMAALMGAERADLCFHGARSFECPVTTLAEFARQQRLTRIDLLKIDVEGSELEVLRGLDPPTWRMVKQVVAEVHDVGRRVGEAKSLLEAAGFAVHAEQTAGGIPNCLLYAWQLEGEQQ